jgi:hypothetical protein
VPLKSFKATFSVSSLIFLFQLLAKYHAVGKEPMMTTPETITGQFFLVQFRAGFTVRPLPSSRAPAPHTTRSAPLTPPAERNSAEMGAISFNFVSDCVSSGGVPVVSPPAP